MATTTKPIDSSLPVGSAVISPDGRYRYRLSRWWGSGPRVLFVMLNPSTADALHDDPTIRRCLGFAQTWGYDGVEVGNLFAYRSRNPNELSRVDDPIGPENGRWLLELAQSAPLRVAAWDAGSSPLVCGRVEEVAALMSKDFYCLGTTLRGAPRHPLYVAAATKLMAFPAPVESSLSLS